MENISNKFTLAQKIHILMGKLAARKDVKIERVSLSIGNKMSKWSEILPADMLDFYKELNGITFFYSIGESNWNGFSMLALDKDGKKTFDQFTRYYKIPHQKVKNFNAYFFHEESNMNPESEVLFFLGDDGAWGLLMIGRGEDARFYHWDNDGFTNHLDHDSFSKIIEQGINRYFGTNWTNKEIHPENQAMLKLLAQEPPANKEFELIVNELAELDEYAYRYFLGSQKGQYFYTKLMAALGNNEVDVNLTNEGCGEWLATTFSDISNFNAAQIKAVMKVVGTSDKNKQAFKEYFRIGGEPVFRLNLSLKKETGNFEAGSATELLIRVLSAIPQCSFCHDCPLDSELILYTNFRYFGFYRPFLYDRNNSFEEGRNPHQIDFELVVTKDRIQGLEVGKRYDSAVLSQIEPSYYTKIERE